MTTRVGIALVLVVAACGDEPASPDASAPPDCACDGPSAPGDPLRGIGEVELVGGGFQFTEGPQWRAAEGDLVFTDIPANAVYRYQPGGAAPSVWIRPSQNANGLALDPAGQLIAAQHGARGIAQLSAPDTSVSLVNRFEGKRFNSPNDLIAAADGTIYFTDPPYGIADAQRELDFMGVFRIAPGGAVTAEHRGPLSARPNGIGLSPDGATLYVADTADGNLYRFPIEAGGALGPRERVAPTAGNADGLAIDAAGNVFVTTSAGVEVFSPDGHRWGAIAVPQQPSNCAFGDPDARTLYITARTGLYRVRLKNPGLPGR